MANKKKQTKAQINSKLQKQYTIWSISIFAVGVLVTLMSVLSFGFVGAAFKMLLSGIFGVLAYAVGPILVYSGVFISRTRDMRVIIPKLLKILSVFLIVSAIWQILSVDMVLYDDMVDRIHKIYDIGKTNTGAGVIGLITSFLFEQFFGKLGAVVVLSIILFVLIMVYTGTTLQELLYKLKGPSESVGDAFKDIYNNSKKNMLKRKEKPVKEPTAEVKTMPTTTKKTDMRVNAKRNIDITIDDILNNSKLKEKEIVYDDILENVKINIKDSLKENKLQELETDILEYKNSENNVDHEKENGGNYLDDVINKAIKNSVEKTKFTKNDDEVYEIGKNVNAQFEESLKEINDIKFNNDDYIEQNIINGDIDEATIDDIIKSAKISDIKNNEPVYSDDEVEHIEFNIKNQETTLYDDNNILSDDFNNEFEDVEKDFKFERSNLQTKVNNKQIKVTVNKKDVVDDTLKQEVLQYDYPSVNLLEDIHIKSHDGNSEELRRNADKLLETLKSFGVRAKLLEISKGPSVTRYELQPDVGVKISKITGLADDIALGLASSGIRIEAPIPNKSAIGIEIPNKNVDMVQIKEIIDSKEFKNAESKLSVALGKDITGEVIIADLAKMPHLLVAGSTGSGKSVCINTIISSLLFKSSPEEVKLLMIDPKVVELGIYNGIPHLLIPVVTDPKKAAGALGWAVSEMLKRYQLFAESNVRDLKGYNKLAEKTGEMDKLPQIVIIIDELADLMMASPKDVEDSICRLAQMARAAGMHLIIATQRPSVDVITGIIKANIPSRIAFSVSSQVDSRTILDSAGAEKLLGRGDMLFYPVGKSKPTRVQGCFVDDSEIERLVEFVKESFTASYDEEVIDEIEKQTEKNSKNGKSNKSDDVDFSSSDPMVDKAIKTAVELGQVSTSMLQRKLRLGYARAARIIDELEERGIVGPMEGSKPRQVLITREQWIEMSLNNEE